MAWRCLSFKVTAVVNTGGGEFIESGKIKKIPQEVVESLGSDTCFVGVLEWKAKE